MYEYDKSIAKAILAFKHRLRKTNVQELVVNLQDPTAFAVEERSPIDHWDGRLCGP
jgi:hypothetical protein